MTGRENIYMNGAIMGMTRAEITRKLDEIVDFNGYERYLDTPVKRYSNLAEVLKNNTVIGKFLNEGKTALNGLYS